MTPSKIDPQANYWISSSCGRVEMQVPGELILDMQGPGPVDDAAEYWVNALDWSGIDDAAIIEDLKEYGCEWDYSDPAVNRARFIWTASALVSEAESPGDYQA